MRLGLCVEVLLIGWIKSVIAFLGLLLPVVHQSWRFGDQLGLSRHCSHLWLWLESSKRPAGTSQGSQDRPEETGNPWVKLVTWHTVEVLRPWCSKKMISILSLRRWIFIDWSPKEQWRRTSLRGQRKKWFWTIWSFREWIPLVELY